MVSLESREMGDGAEQDAEAKAKAKISLGWCRFGVSISNVVLSAVPGEESWLADLQVSNLLCLDAS